MAMELLLIEDVRKLGRTGDLVSVKPGFARNFLIPQKKAVFADANTRRMQTRLKEERAKKAAQDRAAAEEQASHVEGMVLSVTVKVDPEGHMYGSVSALDLVKLFAEKGIEVDKSSVQLAHPIKTTGVHALSLKLKEDVEASFKVKILAEGAAAVEESSEQEETAPEEEKTEE